METRHAVLLLVAAVTVVMAVRAAVALQNGEFGTVGRQVGVGAVVLAFGAALYRRWETLG
jgi:steroid 5-alpha reductase family enzyme